MGRGRAKAKQQKVARELKYSNHMTDLEALQRELGMQDSSGANLNGSADDADEDDEYANWNSAGR